MIRILRLDGKEDGLYFYRKIIAGAGKYLKPGGWILFEIGHDQAEEVSALLAQAGYDKIDVKKGSGRTMTVLSVQCTIKGSLENRCEEKEQEEKICLTN